MKPLSQMGRFATVVVDPPWDISISRGLINHRSGMHRDLPYSAMAVDEIMALPISSVLADDAFLYLWSASRFIGDALRLVDYWGCQYWHQMTWVKNIGPQFPGSPKFNSEACIVARTGSPRFRSTKLFNTANFWPTGGHSEKPEEFYDLLRRVTPEPRLDVFGRRAIAGFHSWGNEAPEGEPPPGHYQDVLSLEEATA